MAVLLHPAKRLLRLTGHEVGIHAPSPGDTPAPEWRWRRHPPPHGRARAADVARALGLSRRTLARRLAGDGLTFVGILDDLRADLARLYLKDPNLTVTEVSWLLGFQEASAFTHACKRWTGQTPTRLRADTRRF